MAASTADRFDLASAYVSNINYPVLTAVTIYQGTMVAVTTAGYARMAGDVAGLQLVGMASRQADNTAGASGAIEVPVQPITALGYVILNADTPLPAWVGDIAYFVDDNTVSNADPGNTVVAGRIEKIVRTGATGAVLINLMIRA